MLTDSKFVIDFEFSADSKEIELALKCTKPLELLPEYARIKE
jgi:hypothetical protein